MGIIKHKMPDQKKLLTLALVSTMLMSSCHCYSEREISNLVTLSKVSDGVFKEVLKCHKALGYFRVHHKVDLHEFNHFFTSNHRDIKPKAGEHEKDLPVFISFKHDQ